MTGKGFKTGNKEGNRKALSLTTTSRQPVVQLKADLSVYLTFCEVHAKEISNTTVLTESHLLEKRSQKYFRELSSITNT